LSSAGVREYERKDSLTGLYNREQFELDREKLVGGGRPFAGIFFDVDDFKRINDDTLGGHEQGDEVLRSVATRAVASLSEQGGMVYRWGGDEFAVLLPVADVDELRDYVQAAYDDITATAVESIVDAQEDITITISGAACIWAAGEEVMQWHQRLDDLLREVKHTGKGRIQVA
jgi:diguanylate cyclase (GGDEF)-like protein